MLARSTLPPLRSLAYFSPSQINTAVQSPFQVFDRQAKRLQKDRAAVRDGGNRSRTVDYVRDEVASRMIERFIVSASSGKLPCCLAETRVQDVKRKFSSVLDLGSGSGHLSKLLEPDRAQKVTMLDLSSKGRSLVSKILFSNRRQNLPLKETRTQILRVMLSLQPLRFGHITDGSDQYKLKEVS
jgi:hypothetical protein